eukprot:SAG31_NODE_4065_length_3623_cov_4.472758_1_plen_146_part_10
MVRPYYGRKLHYLVSAFEHTKFKTTAARGILNLVSNGAVINLVRAIDIRARAVRGRSPRGGLNYKCVLCIYHNMLLLGVWIGSPGRPHTRAASNNSEVSVHLQKPSKELATLTYANPFTKFWEYQSRTPLLGRRPYPILLILNLGD